MKKLYFSIIAFAFIGCFYFIESNNNIDDSINGVWSIKNSNSFLNNQDICYLDEQIEFQDNGYYIFKTKCDSEKPYGLIKVGYYEIKEDSLTFYDQRHSLQIKSKIIKKTKNNLEFEYFVYQLENFKDIVSKKMVLKLNR